MKPLSHLYIHIPFCKKKCSYCAFYSICDLSLIEAYYEALKKDLVMLRERYDVGLKTLYFGGGNPALLGGERMAGLIKLVKELFGSDIGEITMEANPENIDGDYALVLKNAGINRISMGVQSFQREVLKTLGRSSAPDEATKAVESLRSAGFDNINLDLIYGSPNYSLSQLKEDLETLVSLKPEHISTYALQIEEGTALKQKIDRKVLVLPEEELLEEQFEFVIDYLCSQGYRRYEISNYAREGFESRHNLGYWNYANTLGAGASAVYTYQGLRVENVSSVKKYIELAEEAVFPLGEEIHLTEEEQRAEFIMMNLRKASGLSKKAYKLRFATDIEDHYGAWIEKYRKLGLMVGEGDAYYLTDRGLNLSNSILADIL